MLWQASPYSCVFIFTLYGDNTTITRAERLFVQKERKGKMSSTDELREVEVEIKGNEHEAQHGHQMSMGDRDPTSMNDHVKVRRKAAIIICFCI